MQRRTDRCLRCSAVGEADDRPGRLATRRRQHNQLISIHAQHRHPARHLFESSIGLFPIQQLTDLLRQPGSGTVRMGGNQFANALQLLGTEVASAISSHGGCETVERQPRCVDTAASHFEIRELRWLTAAAGCDISARRASLIRQGMKASGFSGACPPLAAQALRYSYSHRWGLRSHKSTL